MRAFVLAAGLGTRLRPLTRLLPKPMVSAGDMPLLERAVRQLALAGITEIGINLFYLPDVITSHLGDGSQFGVRITWFDERLPLPGDTTQRREPLGTGGGLKAAQQFLTADGDDAFVLVNGDAWHTFDLGAVIASHNSADIATMVVHRDRRRPDLHLLDCRPDGTMAGFLHRPPMNLDELEAHEDRGILGIYTGVAVYSARVLDHLPENRVSGLVVHGLRPAVDGGERIAWHEPDGLWVDCGTLAELQRADAFTRSLRALPTEARLLAVGQA
ncbi:MAG: nucleotidyltransferase family protein [Myxococcales bacterium]|nr:nucleotidyltransferase family protein [Myxococcales bacterium]